MEVRGPPGTEPGSTKIASTRANPETIGLHGVPAIRTGQAAESWEIGGWVSRMSGCPVEGANRRFSQLLRFTGVLKCWHFLHLLGT